jgi:radical SAM PhpK family P-methyltransferase
MSQKAHCIIVGYNDIDFIDFAARQKAMEKTSGAYHEVRTNSVLLRGRRYTYMDLINQAIERAQGTNPRLSVFEAPALGAYYLKNFLHQKGLDAQLVNFFSYDKEKFAELLAGKPETVAITTTFYIEDAPVVEIVKFVRKYSPTTKIIVGGPYIFNLSADQDPETMEFLLQEIGADIYIIDSQGEATLARVVECIHSGALKNLARIPNLVFTFDGIEFTRTQQIPENNQLDESAMEWGQFDPAEITPICYLRTARSCPFACTFCNYPTMAGEHVVASLEKIESQLRHLHSIGTTDLVFIDDTFNVPLPRFKNLLRMMVRQRFSFRWISFFRCSNADEEAFDLMKETGCAGVLLGIESGDQQILKYMNKAATTDRYKWGMEHLHKRGIATFASLICGFPGETETSVMNTLKFIEESAPTFFNVQLYYHDTRSPIHKKAQEFEIQGAGYNWRHHSMDWRQAIEWSKYLLKSVKNSGVLSLYGFSLWGVAYLLSRGFSMEQIKKFSHLVKPMLFSSLDDVAMDFSDLENQFTDLFRPTILRPRLQAASSLRPRILSPPT